MQDLWFEIYQKGESRFFRLKINICINLLLFLDFNAAWVIDPGIIAQNQQRTWLFEAKRQSTPAAAMKSHPRPTTRGKSIERVNHPNDRLIVLIFYIDQALDLTLLSNIFLLDFSKIFLDSKLAAEMEHSKVGIQTDPILATMNCFRSFSFAFYIFFITLNLNFFQFWSRTGRKLFSHYLAKIGKTVKKHQKVQHIFKNSYYCK